MRRFQFSIRSLLILTALVAVLAWSVPPQVERYIRNLDRQREHPSQPITGEVPSEIEAPPPESP